MKILNITKNSQIIITTNTTINIFKDNIKLGIIYDLKDSANIVYNIEKNITCEIFVYIKEAANIDEIINVGENSCFTKNKINSRSKSIQYNQDINLEKLAVFNGFYGTFFNKDHKEVNQININHNGKKSISHIISRAIVKKGMVETNCISNIDEKIDDCITEQDLKTIILTDSGKAWNRPILNINNNNVSAKHGCAIGRVNDDQLYYLMSRGFDKENANKLIASGFLKPLINLNYDNISSWIEGDIND